MDNEELETEVLHLAKRIGEIMEEELRLSKVSFKCDENIYEQKEELKQEREMLQELAGNYLDLLFEDNFYD